MKKLFLVLSVLVILATAASAEEQAETAILFGITAETFDDCRLYVSPLDAYGRAGSAFAVLSRLSIDSEQRQDITMFSPAGYTPGGLYHRCHLVGAQLTSGTACAENLVTGTQHLNVDEMLPIENRVRAYVLTTGEHVLYKVTPIYQGAELLPRAVEITAYSLETDGLRLTAYCYNTEPGYQIDYASGTMYPDDGGLILIADLGGADPGTRSAPAEPTYVLNKSSKKFHYPWCNGVAAMKAKNREDFYGTRDEAIALGYEPCGTCNP